jgi:predicted dehydrogenase
MIRVGIAGCGHVADQHVRTVRSIRTARLVGVCDLDRQRANDFARRYGIQGAHAQLEGLLSDATPDVVHLLTPPATHKDLAIRILEAGRHTLIEKPMAVNIEEAGEIVRAESASRGTVCVSHNYLYLPAMRRALELVQQGRLGRIVSAEVYWRITSLDASRSDAIEWTKALPGGAAHEVAPHTIYLLRAVLGELACIAAARAGDDELRLLFNAGDRLGAVTISAADGPVQKYLRIFGARMSLHVDLSSNVLVRIRVPGKNSMARALLNLDYAAQLVGGTFANALRTVGGNMPRSHRAFLQTYYRSLEAGRPVPVTAQDGAAVTRTLDGVWDVLG